MRTTRSQSHALAHPAPSGIQEHRQEGRQEGRQEHRRGRRRSASAPPSPVGRVRLGWENKSIKFIKHTIAKPETTISLQRLYEILQSTPAKKQRDTRPDLSPDVVSLCLQ